MSSKSIAFVDSNVANYPSLTPVSHKADGTGLVSTSRGLTDDYAGTTATAGALALGVAKSGTLEAAYDEDWFKVTLVAGQAYHFEALGLDSGNGTLDDPWLDLYSAAGVLLAQDDDNGTGLNSLVTYTPTTSGSYFVAASAADWVATGTYQIKASVVADDYAATTLTTGTVSVGTAKAGTIQFAGDQDWFKITLTAGTSYTLGLSGVTLADPVLAGVYDASGHYISGTSNDDYGTGANSRVVFTPTASGTYYVSAAAYGTGTGTYLLNVTAQTNTDVPANTSTTATIGVGGIYRSMITPANDVDWIRAALTAGTTYVIELNADTTASSPLGDPYFRGVYNSSGVLISGTTNDDYGIGTNSRITYTPTATGNYYLAAGGYSTTAGAYELRLSSTVATTDAEGATVATTAALTLGTAKTGRIDFARDIDWFRVSLAAGQAYQVTARGADSGAGTLADPQLIGMYNASGQIIAGSGNDDGFGSLDSETVFTPTTGGTYYVAVSAANDGIGSYSVAVSTTASTTDVPANATSTLMMQTGHPLTNIIDVAGDADWFGMTLVAGTTYQINMRGMATANGTLADPVINGVFDATGAALPQTSDDDGGTGANALVSFTATHSGNFFVSVGAYEGGTGTYQLALTSTGADTTAPLLLAMSPVDGSQHVAPSSNLSIEFNEAMRAGSGNILITGGGITRSIAVTDTTQVSFNGSTLSIDPTASLAASTDYTVTLASGVVRDLAGNAFAGITSSTQFNFRTEAPGVMDSWTVMVYMAADNNLEGAGIDDLNEMESVTLPDNINVSVLVDRAPGYATSNGNWTDTRTGFITHDTSLTTLGSTLVSQGELNTGSGATLTNFINTSMASRPADHYALIVWDHGGGLSGTSWDDSSASDNLTMAEYRAAVDASNVAHFDLLGFDACLQGMIEQAWDVSALTDVLVASQELEPGDGWEYQTFLGALAANTSFTAFDLGDAIVDSYGVRYAGEADTTLSATRTSGLTALKTALNAFANAAIAAGSSITDELVSAATRATPIDGADNDYRDLGDFMRELLSVLPGTTVATTAQTVITALGSAILTNVGTVAGANGLSIYLPVSTINASYSMQNFTFLQDTGWGNFLRFMLNDQTNNQLIGNASNNDIRGFGGNDTLSGGAGNDTLDGGNGSDILTAGDGSDVYYVDNIGDLVTETSTIASTDLVCSALSAYTLTANVENGRINTSMAANLTGNAANNVLYAGTGHNVLNGMLGTDTVSYQYATTAINVSLALATAQITGGSGTDTLTSIENLVGGSANDSLTGSTLANSLSGGAGNDVLSAGAGNDLLVGGLGADKLIGGTGADRFDFNILTELGLISTTRDTIMDFKTSEGDKIDLLGVDANTALVGDQAFSYLGTSAFTGDATAKLRFDAVNHILYGSTDADTTAEFAIGLTGVVSLASTDLVL